MKQRDIVEIVDMTPELLDRLCARKFRDSDETACLATTGESVAKKLREGFKLSQRFCKCFLLNGGPVIALGVATESALSAKGAPWLVACPELDTNAELRNTLRKHSRPIRDAMLSVFSRLENHEDVQDTVGMKWMRWLGFIFDAPKPYGLGGRLYSLCYLTREGAK